MASIVYRQMATMAITIFDSDDRVRHCCQFRSIHRRSIVNVFWSQLSIIAKFKTPDTFAQLCCDLNGKFFLPRSVTCCNLQFRNIHSQFASQLNFLRKNQEDLETSPLAIMVTKRIANAQWIAIFGNRCITNINNGASVWLWVSSGHYSNSELYKNHIMPTVSLWYWPVFVKLLNHIVVG